MRAFVSHLIISLSLPSYPFQVLLGIATTSLAFGSGGDLWITTEHGLLRLQRWIPPLSPPVATATANNDGNDSTSNNSSGLPGAADGLTLRVSNLRRAVREKSTSPKGITSSNESFSAGAACSNGGGGQVDVVSRVARLAMDRDAYTERVLSQGGRVALRPEKPPWIGMPGHPGGAAETSSSMVEESWRESWREQRLQLEDKQWRHLYHLQHMLSAGGGGPVGSGGGGGGGHIPAEYSMMPPPPPPPSYMHH